MGKIDFSDVDIVSAMIRAIVLQFIEWEKEGNKLEDFLEQYDKGIAIAKNATLPTGHKRRKGLS